MVRGLLHVTVYCHEPAIKLFDPFSAVCRSKQWLGRGWAFGVTLGFSLLGKIWTEAVEHVNGEEITGFVYGTTPSQT